MGNLENQFFESMLDTLPQQIALVDDTGLINWVNDSWKNFSAENKGPEEPTWQTTNYLTVCKSSAQKGDKDAKITAEGIARVICGEIDQFSHEYPCHSPDVKRWFSFNFKPLIRKNAPHHFVASHSNITARVLAELEVKELATRDGLTGLYNRRYFDEFLGEEWNRAQRHQHSLSLLLFDVDFFKAYNDHYGHPAGDACLQQIGSVLRDVARRPGDLAARYGGEEFAVILGNTSRDHAQQLAEQIRQAVLDLKIPHGYSSVLHTVSISGGIATLTPLPSSPTSPKDLIQMADKGLYLSKESGRNRFIFYE